MSDMLQTLAQNQPTKILFLQVQQQQNHLFMQQIINCLAPEPSFPRPDGLPPPSLVVPYLITSPTDKSTNTIDKIDPTNTNNKTMMIPWPFIWYSSFVDLPFNTNNDDEDDDIMVVCDN